MKEKIIYIYPNTSSFVKNDISFLRKNYIVKEQKLNWSNVLKLPINLILQLVFLLKNLYSSKVIIVNFGGYFSLLPSLLGKFFKVKTVIILNGTDAVSFPKYNYGSLRKPILNFFIKRSYQNATKLLPVDASLIIQNHTFDSNVAYKKQGVKAFFPHIKTSIKVIPNGLDIDFWNFDAEAIKEKDFLTVIAANKKDTATFKGVDLVIEIAKSFPNKTVTIVGLSEELQKEYKHFDNLQFYPFVEKEVLKEIYQRHKFYLQLSVNEGFGCSVAEAMLCGCIPIVSNSGALPHVIGDRGYLVGKRTLKEVSKTIEIATKTNKICADKKLLARKRIVDNFSISKRENLLLQEIEDKI